MTKHLNELLNPSSLMSKENKISKRSFISRNFEKINLALELGHSNKTIIEAIAKDGVDFTYSYFSQALILEYAKRGIDRKKQKRVNNGKLPAKPLESNSHRADLGTSPMQKKANTDSDLSPEKQAIKDEIDKITNDDSLTLAQKREASAKAIASLVNKNPLTNRK